MRKIVLLGNFVLASFLILSPSVEAATCDQTGGGIESVLVWGQCILGGFVVPLLVTVAMVGFIWGVIQYYLNPENEEKRKKGKSFIVGGLLALFVIVSMWGLVGILIKSFDLDTTEVVIPQMPAPAAAPK